MKKTPRRRKYFAPQTEDPTRTCDHPGCQKAGEFRAPKDRKLKEYYWFCLEHVQEYNAKWNYYEGLDEKEETEEEAQKPNRGRRHFRNFGAGVKYSFGYSFKDSFGFFDEYAPEFSQTGSDIWFNEQERGYLKIMELKPGEVCVENIRRQYKKLVKKYHPDLNQGDKESEEKFKLLSTAYKYLLGKFS